MIELYWTTWKDCYVAGRILSNDNKWCESSEIFISDDKYIIFTVKYIGITNQYILMMQVFGKRRGKLESIIYDSCNSFEEVENNAIMALTDLMNKVYD